MLRKIKHKIGNIYRYMVNVFKYNRYRKENTVEYILFGTPIHGNLGDHAITLAQLKLLNDCKIVNVFEVSSFERFKLIDYISKKISPNSLIMINGGGFMGSQWIEEEKMIRDVVKHFPNNKIVIFPQTAFYKDDIQGQAVFNESFKIYNAHKNLILCAREEKTYNFFVEKYKNAKILLIPDIVLYLDKIQSTSNRENALLCMRSDPEKKVSNNTINEVIAIIKNKYSKIDSTDTVIKNIIYPKQREKEVYKKMEEFSNYKIVVTDRLHGMIFAYLTNTPCIVFGNYNHKVEGVYQWIKKSDNILFIKNEEDIKNIDSFVRSINLSSYDIDKLLFNELKNIFMEEK